MSPALADAERAPLGDANNMERMLAELGGGDLLQAIKSLEGELLSGAESSCGISALEAEGERLRRRVELLARRSRTLAARAIGARVARSAGNVLVDAGEGSVCSVLARARTRAALPRRRAPAPRIPNPIMAESAVSLRSHLNLVSSALDSDATASSSGGESDDELISYDNSNQHTLPVENRALYKYLKTRAWIGSRWTWLSAQLQELDYKIRQHTDFLKQVRAAQNRPEPDQNELEGCARTRPVRVGPKPKLLQMHGLHTVANRPSDIRCSCNWPVVCCSVCTGSSRLVSANPQSALSQREKALYLDPAWHRALSHNNDLSPSLHLSAKACTGSWPIRPPKTQQHSHKFAAVSSTSQAAPKVAAVEPQATHSKAKRGRSSTFKRRDTFNSDTSRTRIRTSSYDIDNIVIPQSVAASTRLEVLQYKEIMTPAWRVCDILTPLTNGVIKDPGKGHPVDDEDSEQEDTSDAAIIERHTRALIAERLYYQKKKEQNSKAAALIKLEQIPEENDESPFQPKASLNID